MSQDFPKYPDVTVNLSRIDGNAFSLLGVTQKAMMNAGIEKTEIAMFLGEATSGDYDHLVQTIMRWVNTK